jgi:formylglycine-generating enzyme required for sulfatase activity
MAYVNHADGTLTDANTGLMWQVDEDGEKKQYGEALMYCQMLSLGGYEDWRLPSKEELQVLARAGFEGVKREFSKLQNERYWAASPEEELHWAENPGKIAYTVDFDPRSSNFGQAVTYYRTYSYFVRAVRDAK